MSDPTSSTPQSKPIAPRIAKTDSKLNRIYRGLLTSLGIAGAFLISAPALAQTVGAAQSFAILGGTAVTANGTGSVIDGDVGIDPFAATFITGFPASAIVTSPFSNHGNDAFAIAARAATTTLFNSAELAPAGGTAITANLSTGGPSSNGHYTPGKYSLATGTAIIPTSITLDGPGIYVFSLNSDITTSVGSTVVLNGANPCSVFWRVPTLATLNGVNFPGTVVAGTGVHLGTGAALNGRALAAAAGDVTLAGGNSISTCATPAETAPSSLGMIKTVNNTGGGTATAAEFTLTASGPSTISGPGPSVAAAFAPAGVYTLTETGPTGYTAGYSCSGGGALAGNLLTIAPNGDSTITCTITNTFSGAVPAVTAIPTLSEWAMIVLATLLAIVGFVAMRRKER